MEVLVVDGASDDGTAEVIREYAERNSSVRLLDNEHKTVPYALNKAIRVARGELILRMDAHATYEPEYVLECVKHIIESSADNVGGRSVMVPENDTTVGRAIAEVLADPVGVGSTQFRKDGGGNRWVDTVPYGCYRRDVFDRLGYFDERLTRGQDMEFNLRLSAAGGKILLVPGIVSFYRARGTLAAFIRHNYFNGIWAVYPLAYGKRAFSVRHLAPMAFVFAIAGTLMLSVLHPVFSWVCAAMLLAYAASVAYASIRIAIRRRNVRILGVLPVAFFALHVPYGVGSLVGLVHVLLVRVVGKSSHQHAIYR
jgi:glycosyltransferase involved in cell wall biosynthesis